MQYSLFNSPVDIILHVAGELDLQSLAQLRLTCRDLDGVIAPLVLRNISIRLMPKDLRSLLSTCPKSLARVYANAQHLTVHSNAGLLPVVNLPEESQDSVWDLKLLKLMWPFTSAEKSQAYVWDMIGEMKALKSLKLMWMESDYYSKPVMVEVQEQLLKKVLRATGGHLKKLVWSLPVPCPIPEAVSRFQGLEEFQLIMDHVACSRRCFPGSSDPCVPDDVLNILQQMVHTNSNLFCITVDIPCRNLFFDVTKLFKNASSVQSLHLGGMACPTLIPNQPIQSSLCNLRRLVIGSQFAVLDRFWISLRNAQISLEHLDTAQTSTSLFDYLSSFRGLKSLSIKICPGNLPQDGAATFFNTILRKHSDTLESLSIRIAAHLGAYGEWRYTPYLWNSALTSTPRLVALSLHAPHIRASQSEDFLLAMVDNYQGVITGLECINTLQCLTIYWSEVVRNRRSGYSRWMGKRDALVEDMVMRLRCRDGKPGILKLRTGTYTAEREASGSSWLYRKSA
ncbi:hypothetical protein AX16_004824 [Volvariella volvacea WC 439]|nr:hypothetical protein AX16_004824 [Volvariella volvacea WC 439]